MIKPAGETSGTGLGAVAGDDVTAGNVDGVAWVEASGTALIVSNRHRVSIALPPRLRLRNARKRTNRTKPIRTISKVFVRRRAAHLMNIADCRLPIADWFFQQNS
jgi:hypothetical protein